jgi:hypothetical protein
VAVGKEPLPTAREQSSRQSIFKKIKKNNFLKKKIIDLCRLRHMLAVGKGKK